MNWLKLIHVTCVFLSFSGFFARGIFMIRSPEKLQNVWVKALPHVVDTVLLLSAFLMLYTLQISVIENNWLIAKICALLVYVFLGMLALKPDKSLSIRVVLWVSAMLIFSYIVLVALTKSVTVVF